MFGKRKKRKCTQPEMGQIIYEEIICHEELYKQMKKTIKEDSRTHSNEAEKTAIDSLDETRIEWESFYLWVFLTTHCIQNQFSGYGKEGAKQILDSIHQCIGEKLFQLEHRIDLQNAMNLRFSEYYKAIKTDIQCLGQPDCIVFCDLTEKYFENLFEREIGFSEFGASRLLFGVLVAEVISLLNDTLSKLRKNYDIMKMNNLFMEINSSFEKNLIKIGLHRFRDHKNVLQILRNIGYKKPFFKDVRQFIRETVTNSEEGFNALRDIICIEANYKGKVWFWNGHGEVCDGQQFHRSEIICDLGVNTEPFIGLLQGLEDT